MRLDLTWTKTGRCDCENFLSHALAGFSSVFIVLAAYSEHTVALCFIQIEMEKVVCSMAKLCTAGCLFIWNNRDCCKVLNWIFQPNESKESLRPVHTCKSGSDLIGVFLPTITTVAGWMADQCCMGSTETTGKPVPRYIWSSLDPIEFCSCSWGLDRHDSNTSFNAFLIVTLSFQS